MENYSAIINIINNNRKFTFVHGKKQLVKKLYLEHFNETLKLNDPKTFNQKLNARKLSKNPLLKKCADKNSVRDYVKTKIGEKYLIPQYFCKKHIAKNDLTDLPNSFVLKTTSGSGANIIVKNKSKEDLTKICQKMNSYTKIKYGYLWGEFFYNNINNQIIAEKLLTAEEIHDYKIHCFRDKSGKLRQIIEVLWGPKTNRHKSMYDTNWRPLKYFFSISPDEKTFPKPKQLKKLLDLSAKLSEGTNYVRVDFYIINEKIYFGELTFTPAAGFGQFMPKRYDKIWGSWIGGTLK